MQEEGRKATVGGQSIQAACLDLKPVKTGNVVKAFQTVFLGGFGWN